MPDYRTCKWCGKRYIFNYNGNDSFYCSARCRAAAERERQREREEQRQRREERKKRIDEIKRRGGFGAKLLLIWDIIKWSVIILAIIFVAYFIFSHRSSFKSNSSNQTGDVKTEKVQKSVDTKQSVNEGPRVETVEENDDTSPIVESLDVHDTQPIQSDMQLEFSSDEEDGSKDVQDSNDELVIEEAIDIKTEKQDFSKQKVFDVVDELPVFPGGDQELLKYIAESLNYPKEALVSGIQGRVFVQAIVEPDGSISNPKVIRGIGYGCDEEAVRVVESINGFIPGKKNGKIVRALYTVPVVFSIQ